MHTISIHNVELCYTVLGENNPESIVLIPGLGSQLIRWDEAFCQLLVQKGFQVIRLDNRDSGASVYKPDSKNDYDGDLEKAFEKVKREGPPYSLNDMAADVIALLDHLKIDKAHIAGRSMGGIIGQLLGANYPERVRSLTIIMSTSLNPNLPPVAPDVMAMMTKPAVDASVDREAYITHALTFAKRIAGTAFPLDEEQERKMIETELKRSKPGNSVLRQLLAMGSWSYQEAILNKIMVPTQIIHGTEDPIFHPECARDLVRSIPDAKLELIEGMGHAIPPECYTVVTELIVANTKRQKQ
ncbi:MULTISPECIES: alpha/beta hydrolase [unclassified Flavobacterium]|uniref:alpha/beta fold hydrolase n=1 Tax=unclassified Flavobacterium TaxID=196869 RepID=UPI00260B7C50|nr:alpha/beta hydrolase [Flavobacterium sp.]